MLFVEVDCCKIKNIDNQRYNKKIKICLLHLEQTKCIVLNADKKVYANYNK